MSTKKMFEKTLNAVSKFSFLAFVWNLNQGKVIQPFFKIE